MVAVAADDFAGCSRDCREGHNYEWGRCELGVQPLPVLSYARSFATSDGYGSVGFVSLALALFLPWSAHLPTVDQHQMLDELAAAEPDGRDTVLAAWRVTAEALSDSVRRDVLLGESSPGDYVEAERPKPEPCRSAVSIGAMPYACVLPAGHDGRHNRVMWHSPGWQAEADRAASEVPDPCDAWTCTHPEHAPMGQLEAALAAATTRAEKAERAARLLLVGLNELDRQRTELDAVTRAETESVLNELRTRAEKAEAKAAYWHGRTEAAWEQGDRLANDLVVAVFGDDERRYGLRQKWARIAALGDPEPEYRFVDQYGTESDFDLHNGSCNCRREVRDVYVGEWRPVDDLNTLPSRADVEAQAHVQTKETEA